MDKEKREELGILISELILTAINELEKEMAEKCIDYGQLTRDEKERFIDEILFYFLFRVDILLFTTVDQTARMTVKETILAHVFAPLSQEHQEQEVVAVMKTSIDRFTEYSQVFRQGQGHLEVYPLLRKHLRDINNLIVEGTEGSKNALYSFFVQKNAEGALSKRVREMLDDGR